MDTYGLWLVNTIEFHIRIFNPRPFWNEQL